MVVNKTEKDERKKNREVEVEEKKAARENKKGKEEEKDKTVVTSLKATFDFSM